MLRKILKVKSKEYLLNLPTEYMNKTIEILVLPLENEEKEKDIKLKHIEKTAGILKDKNIDPVEWQRKIRSEWDRD